jgi:transposase-like protein
MCHACGKKFTVRRDTVLYHLKTHSDKVAQALALMAEGVDISTLERVMGFYILRVFWRNVPMCEL